MPYKPSRESVPAAQEIFERILYGAPAPPTSSYAVPGGVLRATARDRGVAKAYGYEIPAEQAPTWFEGILDALSFPSYASVEAVKRARAGGDIGNVIGGYLQGAYRGLRTPLEVLKNFVGGYVPPVGKLRLPEATAAPEYWSEYIHTIPGFEIEPETSSSALGGGATWRNYLKKLVGLGVDILADPITYISGGTSLLWQKGGRALIKEGLEATRLLTPGGRRLAAFLMARDELLTKRSMGVAAPAREGAEVSKIRLGEALESLLERGRWSKHVSGEGGKVFKSDVVALTRKYVKELDDAFKKEGPIHLAPPFSSKNWKTLVSHQQYGKTGLPYAWEASQIPKGVRVVSQHPKVKAVTTYEMNVPPWLEKLVTSPIPGTKIHPLWRKEQVPVESFGTPQVRGKKEPPPATPREPGPLRDELLALKKEKIGGDWPEKFLKQKGPLSQTQRTMLEDFGKQRVLKQGLRELKEAGYTGKLLELLKAEKLSKRQRGWILGTLRKYQDKLSPEIAEAIAKKAPPPAEAVGAAQAIEVPPPVKPIPIKPPPVAKPPKAEKPPKVPKEPKEVVFEDTPLRRALRHLAERDLNKVAGEGPAGFGKRWTRAAYDILALPKWSKRQEAVVKRLVRTYHKQLPDELLKEVFPEKLVEREALAAKRSLAELKKAAKLRVDHLPPGQRLTARSVIHNAESSEKVEAAVVSALATAEKKALKVPKEPKVPKAEKPIVPVKAVAEEWKKAVEVAPDAPTGKVLIKEAEAKPPVKQEEVPKAEVPAKAEEVVSVEKPSLLAKKEEVPKAEAPVEAEEFQRKTPRDREEMRTRSKAADAEKEVLEKEYRDLNKKLSGKREYSEANKEKMTRRYTELQDEMEALRKETQELDKSLHKGNVEDWMEEAVARADKIGRLAAEYRLRKLEGLPENKSIWPALVEELEKKVKSLDIKKVVADPHQVAGEVANDLLSYTKPYESTEAVQRVIARISRKHEDALAKMELEARREEEWVQRVKEEEDVARAAFVEKIEAAEKYSSTKFQGAATYKPLAKGEWSNTTAESTDTIADGVLFAKKDALKKKDNEWRAAPPQGATGVPQEKVSAVWERTLSSPNEKTPRFVAFYDAKTVRYVITASQQGQVGVFAAPYVHFIHENVLYDNILQLRHKGGMGILLFRQGGRPVALLAGVKLVGLDARAVEDALGTSLKNLYNRGSSRLFERSNLLSKKSLPEMMGKREEIFSRTIDKSSEAWPGTRAARGEILLSRAVNEGKLSKEYLKPLQALWRANKTFRDRVEFLYTEKSYAIPQGSLRAQGVPLGEAPGVAAGFAELNAAGKSFLTLTKYANPQDVGHEAWHFAAKFLLSEQDRSTIRGLHMKARSPKSAAEWSADEFGKYILDRPFYKGLAGTFRRIADTFVRALKALGGDSSAKLQQVFERALKRDYLEGVAESKTVAFKAVGKTSEDLDLPPSVEEVAPGVLAETPDIPKEMITEYRRSGLLLLMDSLMTPINIRYRKSGKLLEMDREFKARDSEGKRAAMDLVSGFLKIFGKNAQKESELMWDFIQAPNKFKFASAEQEKRMKAALAWHEQYFSKETGEVPMMLKSMGVSENFLDDYLTHIYQKDPEMREMLIEIHSRYPRLVGADPFSKHRTLTLEDIKRLGLQVEKNVMLIDAIRYLTARRAVNKRMYLQDILHKTGPDQKLILDIPQVKPGQKPRAGDLGHPQLDIPKEYATLKKEYFPEFEGKLIRDDLLIHLNDRFSAYSPAQGAFRILKAFTKFWKPLATIWNPRFHARNVVGNGELLNLAGMKEPVRLLQAAIVQMPTKGVALARIAEAMGAKWVKVEDGKAHLKIYDRWVSGEAFREHLMQAGVARRGFFSQDLEQLISDQILEITRPGALYKWKRLAQEAGVGLEDNARIALYLDRLYKGHSSADAASAVRLFLFDYDDLTKTERNLRVSIPFWSWYKNNVPLQVEYFLRRPGKLSGIAKATGFFSTAEEREEQRSLLPRWMRELQVFASPVWAETPQGEKRFVVPGLPYEDIAKATSLREMVGLLNPVYKMGLEEAFNRDFFTGAPFYPEGLEGHPSLQYRKVSAGYRVIPKVVWPLLGMHVTQDPYTRKPVLVANVRLVRLWNNIFRPGREALKLTDMDKSLLDRAFGVFSGFSIIPINERRERLMRAFERREEAKQVRRRVEQLRQGEKLEEE